MPERILVVEDEWQMRILLRDNLQFEGFDVACAPSGEEALIEVAERVPDLILLDVMLPGIDGFEVCRRLREHDVSSPIVVITARTSESERVAGLDLGADDYVVKPFSMPELVARIRAQLRRQAGLSAAGQMLRVGDTVINLKKRSATRHLERIELSYREFELLRYFAAHRGEVIPREQLLREVWGYSAGSSSRTVDNFVARLRHKLQPDSDEPTCIVTVHGVGYRFEP